jgi:hypothetical protein
MWLFFKETRDKKLDSIRCGRRFVSKIVRRGGFFYSRKACLRKAGRKEI